MVDLQQIKDEYAGEHGRDSWDEFFQWHELCHTHLDTMQYHHDQVAKRYGEQMYNQGVKYALNS